MTTFLSNKIMTKTKRFLLDNMKMPKIIKIQKLASWKISILFEYSSRSSSSCCKAQFVRLLWNRYKLFMSSLCPICVTQFTTKILLRHLTANWGFWYKFFWNQLNLKIYRKNIPKSLAEEEKKSWLSEKCQHSKAKLPCYYYYTWRHAKLQIFEQIISHHKYYIAQIVWLTEAFLHSKLNDVCFVKYFAHEMCP